MSFASLFDPSILRSALLPAFQQHLALTVPAYALGRGLDRYESKDVLWGLSPVLVAWYSLLGRRTLKLSFYNYISITTALRSLGRTERLLLTGITLWGLRLSYRVVSRSIRRGSDDPRYASLHSADKSENSSNWTWAYLTTFIPEAAAQTLLTLPFTLLANVPNAKVLAMPAKWQGTVEATAIGLWGAAFGLEVLADWQLARHQKEGREGMCRDGVWSIVRHPNYLADFLLSLSYPLLHLSSSTLSPFHLLSPLTNYLFLRFIGGDAQTEAHQERKYMERDPTKMLDLVEMREAENAFWPGWAAVANVWSWGVVGLGVGVVGVERYLRGARLI